jgi:hypothetical protein
MPLTVVTPFATYRNRMCSTSSREESGAGKCPCISANPGMRYFPADSIFVAPVGIWILPDGPMLPIRPSRMMTVWRSRTRLRSIGITLTSSNTMVCAGAAAGRRRTADVTVPEIFGRAQGAGGPEASGRACLKFQMVAAGWSQAGYLKPNAEVLDTGLAPSDLSVRGNRLHDHPHLRARRQIFQYA